MPVKSSLHEIELEMDRFIQPLLPMGYQIIDLIPGMLVFVSEKETHV